MSAFRPVLSHVTLKGVALLLALFLVSCEPAEQKGQVETSSHGIEMWEGYTPHMRNHVSGRLDELAKFPVMGGGVLFLGDSLTEFMDLEGLFPDTPTGNFGIAGDTTDGVLTRLEQVTRHRPDRLILLIGTNDYGFGFSNQHILDNIADITDTITAEMPDTQVYVLSLLPRGLDAVADFAEINSALARRAEAGGYIYVDVREGLADAAGMLKPALTMDGLHLNAQGYGVLADAIRPYVTGAD